MASYTGILFPASKGTLCDGLDKSRSQRPYIQMPGLHLMAVWGGGSEALKGSIKLALTVSRWGWSSQRLPQAPATFALPSQTVTTLDCTPEINSSFSKLHWSWCSNTALEK